MNTSQDPVYSNEKYRQWLNSIAQLQKDVIIHRRAVS